ncbi:MAG: hypothetical protein ACT4OS_10490 [Acidimicrobiales bacterium]
MVPEATSPGLVVALVLPGGLAAARAELARVLLAGAYEDGLASLNDPEIADQ